MSLRGRGTMGLIPCLIAAACECGHPPGASTTPALSASTVVQPRNAPDPGVRATAPHAPPAPFAQRRFPPDPAPPPLSDKGIFSDLDTRVRLQLPSWLEQGPAWVVQSASPPSRLVLLAGEFVGFAPSDWPPDLVMPSMHGVDRDGDGIPDSLDILMGAKKVVLNGAAYRDGYRVLEYPGGDMPRTEGVCTDVAVRALRNAGYDLQQLVHEDARSRPAAYPAIRKLDRNIDHRRVRNLQPYFEAHWRRLPADPRDTTVPWLPGDVVLLDTMHDPRPEHMGLVSDRLGASGLPLIVNNWTTGHTTSEMDLLAFVPVTHRYRAPGGALEAAQDDRGAAAWLRRLGLRVDGAHRQLVLVAAPWWGASAGVLHRFERSSGVDGWSEVLPRVEVRLGAGGIGRGQGLHTDEPGALAALSPKREGDRRSPAGVFLLGTAFGTSSTKPYMSGTWPWRAVGSNDVWVDDPDSPHYNTWQVEGDGDRPWRSAERLSSYGTAVVVEHNTRLRRRGAGSAIFLHDWPEAEPTLGCTGLSRDALRMVLDWMQPGAKPVLVQGAGQVF